MPGAEVDEIATRLYALPPERFTAARDEQVAQVRQAGDKALAKEIAGLRRPTVAAWLVNLLAIERPDQVTELLELGDQLRSAQHDLRGAQLRELSARRRAVVDALAAQARSLARDAGRPASDNLPLDEVVATLNAALSDVEVGRTVRAGRLVRPASYAGFGEVPALGSERPALRVVTGATAPSSAESGQDETVEPERGEAGSGRKADREAAAGAAAEKARSGRAARVAAAQERLRVAQDELTQAEEGYRQAEAALEEVAQRLAEVQREHASAQVAVSRAVLRRKSAQRGVTVAARAVPPSG